LDAEDAVKRAVEIEKAESGESGESYERQKVERQKVESQKVEVGIAKGLCKADLCEVYDAWQPSVSSEPVSRGNEKGQRWDDVPQHTEH
jgi:hypothetical protein